MDNVICGGIAFSELCKMMEAEVMARNADLLHAVITGKFMSQSIVEHAQYADLLARVCFIDPNFVDNLWHSMHSFDPTTNSINMALFITLIGNAAFLSTVATSAEKRDKFKELHDNFFQILKTQVSGQLSPPNSQTD